MRNIKEQSVEKSTGSRTGDRYTTGDLMLSLLLVTLPTHKTFVTPYDVTEWIELDHRYRGDRANRSIARRHIYTKKTRPSSPISVRWWGLPGAYGVAGQRFVFRWQRGGWVHLSVSTGRQELYPKHKARGGSVTTPVCDQLFIQYTVSRSCCCCCIVSPTCPVKGGMFSLDLDIQQLGKKMHGTHRIPSL